MQGKHAIQPAKCHLLLTQHSKWFHGIWQKDIYDYWQMLLYDEDVLMRDVYVLVTCLLRIKDDEDYGHLIKTYLPYALSINQIHGDIC